MEFEINWESVINLKVGGTEYSQIIKKMLH